MVENIYNKLFPAISSINLFGNGVFVRNTSEKIHQLRRRGWEMELIGLVDHRFIIFWMQQALISMSVLL
jgi:hypothetical protein